MVSTVRGGTGSVVQAAAAASFHPAVDTLWLDNIRALLLFEGLVGVLAGQVVRRRLLVRFAWAAFRVTERG